MSASESIYNEGDLIDLHVGSPILPRVTTVQLIPEVSDNLLDSELPVLEQKLQGSNNSTNAVQSTKIQPSVDIEDILISIDDEDDNIHSLVRLNPIRRSNSEVLLNFSLPKPVIDKSWSCDNLEALDVLKSLDDILNASLLESDNILNKNSDEERSSEEKELDEQTQQTVEACLVDLDNYLHELETNSSEDVTNDSSEAVSLDVTENQRSNTSSIQDIFEAAGSSLETLESMSEAADDNIRNRLRQMEENYTRFLASGCVNRGYIDTENNGEIHKTESEVNIRRPLSACGVRSEALNRGHPYRATVAVINRDRPVLHEFTQNVNSRCTTNRTSGTAGESDEDIDWSWVQDIEAERRAHAVVDCCTGTVIVEPLHGAATDPSSSTEAAMTDASKEDEHGTTWLRSSMRRLRHFRLPSDAVTSDQNENDVPIHMEEQITDSFSVQVVDSSLLRPVSAPSRLLPANNDPVPLTRASQRSRSRSRSREMSQSAVSHEPGGRARSSSASSRSRRPRSLSSSVSSLASTVDSSPSCTPAPTPTHNESQHESNSRRPCERTRQNDMPECDSPLGQWPHSLSSMMACLGCTLGLFNISRFAILTIHFGANFIFQFFFLSLVFGLPLFTLQLCLGQQLGAGVIDMWRISPLFQGVGVALLLTQAMLGIYSIIGVSWMFVFFRDSFITRVDKYRWAEPFLYYREDIQLPVNGSYKLSETIPDYFSGIVLQRHHLASGHSYSAIKFQLAFNLAVVWMIVFVSLSKGLRSYGKVIYIFTLLPVFGTFILCAKILGMMPPEYINVIFPETTWGEFFLNPKSWLAAAQEVFLTWGILGTAAMQIASHNKNKHLLQRDSSLIAVVTFTILLLMAFLANTCVQILRSYGYNYLPNSFERMSSYTFLRPLKDPLPPSLASTPVKYMVHNSFFVGEKVVRPGVDPTKESGFQVLRLATELIPATFAVLGADQVSPFWAVLFYFILILFGIAQQLAIWHCVITGIMAIKAKILKSWETTITLFSCIFGFILGLPMATEFGIFVVYFMDYTIGGIWWLILIILLQIVAVFMVRGRPYSGDTVVTALFTSNSHPCIVSWAPVLLSFTWNVILPVALMVLCITTFKNGSFREMFIWHHAPTAEYWPLWARQFGSLLQLIPVLLVPLVAVIQSYRYLNNGPSDILDRIQLLYRPPLGEHMTDLGAREITSANLNNNTSSSSATTNPPSEDPPPKYTPPPSYTTATGARIAKFLRQSIRRSVRRLTNVLGESSNTRQRGTIVNQTQPPPPDYNDVLVEMNQANVNGADISIIVPDSTVNGANASSSNVRISTLERLRAIQPTPGSPTITAAEVASILRSSFRRSNARITRNAVRNNFNEDNNASLSAENLVDSAAPIGETSLVMEYLPNSDANVKTESNNSSVI